MSRSSSSSLNESEQKTKIDDDDDDNDVTNTSISPLSSPLSQRRQLPNTNNDLMPDLQVPPPQQTTSKLAKLRMLGAKREVTTYTTRLMNRRRGSIPLPSSP